MFSVGKSTFCEVLLQFCNDVWKILTPIYLENVPLTREKIEVICQEFEILGFPQCIGALGEFCKVEFKLLLCKRWQAIATLRFTHPWKTLPITTRMVRMVLVQ